MIINAFVFMQTRNDKSKHLTGQCTLFKSHEKGATLCKIDTIKDSNFEL